MSTLQRLGLAFGLLGIVALLLWVPYTATYKWSNSSWTTASAGYDWIFDEPKFEVCRFAIEEHTGDRVRGFDRKRCHVALDTRRLLITLSAACAGAIAILLLIGFPRRGEARPKNSSKSEALAELSKSDQDLPESTLARKLLQVNPLLPIGSGNLSERTPLIITAKKDYVSIEYLIIDIMHTKLSHLTAELKTQALIERGGRHIDALTYEYAPKDGQGSVRRIIYYFDITEGMLEVRRKLGKQWWQVWR